MQHCRIYTWDIFNSVCCTLVEHCTPVVHAGDCWLWMESWCRRVLYRRQCSHLWSEFCPNYSTGDSAPIYGQNSVLTTPGDSASIYGLNSVLTSEGYSASIYDQNSVLTTPGDSASIYGQNSVLTAWLVSDLTPSEPEVLVTNSHGLWVSSYSMTLEFIYIGNSAILWEGELAKYHSQATRISD